MQLTTHVVVGASVVLAALAAGWYGAYAVFSAQAWEEFMVLADTVREDCGDDLLLENLVGEIKLPGCGELEQNFSKLETCGPPCVDPSFVESMRAFEASHPGERVSYPSRSGTGEDGNPLQVIQLEGVWRAADPKFGDGPIVVLQHGFTSSSNNFRPLVAGYLLRSAGFGVLSNNLRDHCYSGSSAANVSEWGHAYPYDLLGAWDFAVSNPGGRLGGAVPRQPQEVGIMGFSMGAFIATTTLGLEPAIPAAWADGPPLNAETAFAGGARLVLSSYTAGINLPDQLLLTHVWNGLVRRARDEHGVDVMENFPERTLPLGPNHQRPLHVSANRQDTEVPVENAIDLIAFAARFPMKYKVTSHFYDGACHGVAHCIDHLQSHALYRQQLCDFWTAAFSLQADYCQLPTLEGGRRLWSI